ncbi:hypothetical protein AVEN_213319-1 [Araneus ventricosus]|uniref:Uncharacterized protein n=1 Tax=Araneus ventricosus TaxID=182803 RepID=A0A4Y2LJQ5_ARAVE|nr:hypothetical protein AVEN_213319-1 [Araneus ventricosus]
MVKDALFANIPENTKHMKLKKQHSYKLGTQANRKYSLKQSNKEDNGERRSVLEYSRRHEAHETEKAELVQIRNTSRQKVTDNNSNITSNSAQRLIADQFSLGADSKRFSLSFEPPAIYSSSEVT